jgi:hypothetical protein
MLMLVVSGSCFYSQWPAVCGSAKSSSCGTCRAPLHTDQGSSGGVEGQFLNDICITVCRLDLPTTSSRRRMSGCCELEAAGPPREWKLTRLNRPALRERAPEQRTHLIGSRTFALSMPRQQPCAPAFLLTPPTNLDTIKDGSL